MIIIVCLDDQNGMCFNNRRQSRDQYLCRRVSEMAKQKALWLSDYSKPLFDGFDGDIRVDPMFLEKAGDGEYCFVEDRDITAYLHKVEMIVVFRWNRTYPSDMKFPAHLLENTWHSVEVRTFPGKSHEQITQEVYLP